jgi:hypothetical protein
MWCLKSFSSSANRNRGRSGSNPAVAIYYKPTPGFRGDDVFRSRICGTEGGFKGFTDINMRVVVR